MFTKDFDRLINSKKVSFYCNLELFATYFVKIDMKMACPKIRIIKKNYQ